eukprot:m.224962 g.224962  ORF g.224962 m.224962 type:complete len:637 (-) comp26377_c0_seq3:48-1958(-)
MLDDGFIFACCVLYLLAGLQQASFAWLTFYCSGYSVFSMLVASAFSLIYLDSFTTRVTTSPFLRENFAMPFLWLQVYCLVKFLTDHVEGRLQSPFPWGSSQGQWLIVTTISILLPWQFVPFLMLLEFAAVFVTFLLGHLPSVSVRAACQTLTLGLFISALLLFANPMYLVSLSFIVGICTEASFWIVPAAWPQENRSQDARLERKRKKLKRDQTEMTNNKQQEGEETDFTKKKKKQTTTKSSLRHRKKHEVASVAENPRPESNQNQQNDQDQQDEEAINLVPAVLDVLRRLVPLLVVCVLVLGAKLLLAFSSLDDAHVFKLFKAKLFGIEDFMSGLYLCGPTYSTMPLSTLSQMNDSFMLSAGISGLALLGLSFVSELIHDLKAQDVRFVFTGSLCVLFASLGFFVLRLSILMVPSIAFLASLCVSPRFLALVFDKISGSKRSSKTTVFTLLCLVLTAGLFYHFHRLDRVNYFFQDLQLAEPNPNYRPENFALMNFLHSTVTKNDVVAADPVIACSILLLLKPSVVIHPHVENAEIRKKQHTFFQVFNRLPEKEVHSLIKEMGAHYLVIADGPCDVRCGPRNQFTMADLANLENEFGVRGNGSAHLAPFCQYARTGKLTYFTQVYYQSPFMVLRVH